jgi:hypothetical protein
MLRTSISWTGVILFFAHMTITQHERKVVHLGVTALVVWILNEIYGIILIQYSYSLLFMPFEPGAVSVKNAAEGLVITVIRVAMGSLLGLLFLKWRNKTTY